MPVMDGHEAARMIRASAAGRDVAIIGVTASALAEVRQGVFDAEGILTALGHSGESR